MRTFVLDNQRGYQNLKTNNMKRTKIANTFIGTSKGNAEIEFQRYGEKGKPKTKELFWITIKGKISEQKLSALTLDDLKLIAKQAEELIKIADE